jgi:tetratricopeptide (TPR) repeat protein
MNKKLSISSFTPSTMSHELLELLFVQREELLRSVVDDLAESVIGMKKYVMLVGERGMGKTHFVSLVYHRLKLLPALQDKLLVAWLREEEYGVNSWLYLIVEILRALAEEGLETQGYIDRLAKMGIEDAQYLANRLLAETIGDKTLVIITENLDKLLAGLGDREQWKFRAFLQEQNSCSILATTPKISLDTSSKDRPFFGFFSRIDLPRFSLDDGLAMLAKTAEISGDIDLVEFLNTGLGKARVAALHYLAGGNPRVYTLFSQLVTKDSLIDLLPAMTELLDKLTPYYQSQVDCLRDSHDQQKIVMYLARSEGAVMVKEIAEQCFISSERATSNALTKLKNNGYVVSEKHGREVYYEISEALMRLCLEMKSSRSSCLKLCVDFLKIWYPPEDLRKYFYLCIENDNIEHAKYYREAMSSQDSPANRHFLIGLDLYEQQKWQESLTVFNQCINDGYEDHYVWLIKSKVLREIGNYDESIYGLKKAIKIKADYLEAWQIQGALLYCMDKYVASVASFDRAIEIKPLDPISWSGRSAALYSLKRYEEAVDSFNKALGINPENKEALHNQAIAMDKWGKYQFSIGEFSLALDIWQKSFDLMRKVKTIDIVGLIQEFLDALLVEFQDSKIQDFIPKLLTVYNDAGIIADLSAALIYSLKELDRPSINEKKAVKWLETWQKTSTYYPELDTAIKLMETFVDSKYSLKDGRNLLSIPKEIRPLFERALRPIKVFLSYSRCDIQMADMLIKHLSALLHRGLISVWHYRDIAPGQIWEEEIESAIEEADIILLLISCDFLASDYCYTEISKSLIRMQEEKIHVIPIIVRACDYNSSLLDRLSVLPKDGKPIAAREDQHNAFFEVVKGIEKICEDLRRSRQSVSPH